MSVSHRNSGIHTGVTQAHEKCVMKIKERNKKERKKKKRLPCKIFMKEGLCMAEIKTLVESISMNLGSTTLHTLKVLFV